MCDYNNHLQRTFYVTFNVIALEPKDVRPTDANASKQKSSATADAIQPWHLKIRRTC